MNKRGAITDLFVWIAVSIVMVVFFGAILYGMNLVNDEFNQVGNVSETINFTDISQDTFGQVVSGLDYLKTIAFLIFFFLGMSMLISNFLVKAHPVFYVVYILVLIVAVIFSIFVSNAYESLLTSNVLSPTFLEFSAMNFVMLNLPVWVCVFGIFGAILLFAGIPREISSGGGLT